MQHKLRQSEKVYVVGSFLVGGLGIFLWRGGFPVMGMLTTAWGMVECLNVLTRKFPHRILFLLRWCRASVLELFAAMTIFLLRPFAWASYTVRGKATSPRPLLCIHGYLHHRFAWVYIERALARRGFGPIYTVNLGSPFCSMEEYGKKVEKKLAQIPENGVTLVGHSMGGLVALWCAAHLDPQKKVQGVITIGSPLLGTHVATFGFGQSAKDMRIGSPFLEQFQKTLSSFSLPLLSMASRTDAIILPHHSANPKQDGVVFSDLGHVSMLFSPRVVDEIARFKPGFDGESGARKRKEI